MPSGCNAVRVYAIKTSESRLLGVRGRKIGRNEGRGGAEEKRRKRRREYKRERLWGRESQREQMAQGEVKGIIPSAALSTDHLDIPLHNYNTFQQAEQRTASQGHIRPVWVSQYQSWDLLCSDLRSVLMLSTANLHQGGEKRIRTNQSLSALGRLTAKWILK